MRLIVNDYAGHPFQVELSRELAVRGHNVLHLFSATVQTPKGDLTPLPTDPLTFRVEGVVHGAISQKYNFIKRRAQEIAYGEAVCKRMRAFQPDALICCNNPLDALTRIVSQCRGDKIPFIFWIQDVLSGAIKSIFQQRLSVAGTLIGLWYESIERKTLIDAQHVVAISEDFIPQLKRWSVASSNVSIVENWAPKDKITVLSRDNSWAREHNLVDKRVILYTGTIGLKHNPDLLLTIAAAFAHLPEVVVVVTSEGKYAEYVRTEAAKRGLPNLMLLPFQPFDRYAEVLASADILVAMIEPDAATYSVPSKVLSYLCSGRAIVLASDRRNLAAKILERAQGGIVVDPHDHSAMTNALTLLFADRPERERAGRSGRQYADKAFDIKNITDQFEHVMSRARNKIPSR
jgi:colanic acid biosynthesis glycosyl transferase WcaI